MDFKCDPADAMEAADMLDKSDVGGAVQKLYDCAYQINQQTDPAPGSNRNFAAQVAQFDNKGVGSDISLKFSMDRSTYKYDGFEIK